MAMTLAEAAAVTQDPRLPAFTNEARKSRSRRADHGEIRDPG